MDDEHTTPFLDEAADDADVSDVDFNVLCQLVDESNEDGAGIALDDGLLSEIAGEFRYKWADIEHSIDRLIELEYLETNPLEIRQRGEGIEARILIGAFSKDARQDRRDDIPPLTDEEIMRFGGPDALIRLRAYGATRNIKHICTRP